MGTAHPPGRNRRCEAGTLIRHDEDMTLKPSMNIGLHPTFGNAKLFVTVCDNFLIDASGKIENLHKTPRKIFEL